LIQKWVQELADLELDFETVRDIVRQNLQALQIQMEHSLSTLCADFTQDNLRAFEEIFYKELR
jgi:hypothetical protein